ncbi:unnamed protein product [Psylliodes chrysocephalus]|uniref:RZ-type domain-containing protein n=1 Tax=Psylliodes chrysocephalus TaxID=3402493 RepID=A0A9P0GN11_9CUCU|nr:unnamed protein product [Psylliodes chrysocephala]
MLFFSIRKRITDGCSPTKSLDEAYYKLLGKLEYHEYNRKTIDKMDLDGIRIKIDLIQMMIEPLTKEKLSLSNLPRSNKHISLIAKYLEVNTFSISQQEVNDISLEINRLHRWIQLERLQHQSFLNDSIKTKVEDIVNALNKYCRYDETQDGLIKTSLEELKELTSSAITLSETEKKYIIKAVGLSRGHWYKCSNGHPYAIGECGGAMEISNLSDQINIVKKKQNRRLSKNPNIVSKNQELEDLKQEIEKLKLKGASQDDVNKKIEELKLKTEDLNKLSRELEEAIIEITIDDLKELTNRIINLENNQTTFINKIRNLERLNKNSLKKLTQLDIVKLNKQIEELKKSGAPTNQIDKKIKELEQLNTYLKNIITDITDNDLTELDERVEHIEVNMKAVKNKLSGLNITPTYISVRGRIVKALDAVDDYDLVTKRQLAELERRLKNTTN